jgi:hypothetical protein
MSNTTFQTIFPESKPIIGMIHVAALPGTPDYEGHREKILATALEESKIYLRAGVDGILIENMHDRPYLKRQVGPEIVAFLAVIGHELKHAVKIPCGVQILAGANQEALGVALAAGLDFIRVEGFVFSHVADEGLIEADAGPLLRYRKQIDAEEILIFTDIKKKHSAHTITKDVSLADTACTAEFFHSDGIIVTGRMTGMPTQIKDLQEVKSATSLPILVGSGITQDNVEDYLPLVDGLIVGSHFKQKGKWFNQVDYDRVARFMDYIREQRL